MSFVERIKVTDGTEVASVNASNQLEVAEANSNAIKTAVELVDDAVFTAGGSASGNEKLLLVGGVNDDSSLFTPLKFNDDGWLRTKVEMGVVSIGGEQTHDAIFQNDYTVVVGGYASSSAPTAVTAGDACRIWTTLNGAINIADGNGTISIDDGSGSITVDGTVAATQSGTWILGANSGVDIGDVTINNASIAVTGTFWQATQPVSGTVSITANSSVNMAQIGGTNTVNGGTAGTIAVGGIQAHDAAISNNNPILCGSYYAVTPTDVASGDVTRTWASPKGALLTGAKYEASAPSFFGDTVYHLTLAQDGRLRVDVDFTGKTIATGGNVAHDIADTGNPIKIGAKAIAHGTNPTAVADADRTNLYANRHGILWTIGGHPNLQSAEYITTAAQTSGGDNVLPLISAGTKYVITGVTVTASAANTVNTSVRLGFGTTGVPTQGASAADAVTKVILSHPGIAPGSGVSKGHAGGIVGIGGDGEELYIVCSVPTGGSVVVQVDYYTIES